MLRLTLGVAFVAGVLLLAGSALAEEPAPEAPNPDKLVEQAIVAFNEGDLPRSRELLLQALRQSPRKTTLAKVHLYLGLNAAGSSEPDRARQHFKKALLANPRLEIDANRYKPSLVAMFTSVRRATLGQLRVTANRKQVELWLDGHRQGLLPHQAWMPAGDCRLELRSATGEVLYQATQSITAGESTNVAVKLKPVAVPASAPAAVPPSPAPKRTRLWTWIVAGGALASTAAAIGLGISSRADRNEACSLLSGDDLPCSDRTQLKETGSYQEYTRLNQRVSDKGLAANVLFAAAGAMAIGAIVLYWLEGRPEKPRLESHLLLKPWGPGLGFSIDY